VITVADEGTGIATDDLDDVFKAFYTTKTEGTGLGLAVVRDLVRAHGGQVDLQSELGRGTTFSLSLPRVGV
jgi:signal transduction histidine kinase